MNKIGNNIKTLRSARNMTQDELAEKLFVTRQTVSNYETGKSKPDVDMLVRISQVLDVDVNRLIGAPEEPGDHTTRRRLLIGTVLTTLLAVVFALFDSFAKDYARQYYIVSLVNGNRVLLLPLIFLFAGWTVMQLLEVTCHLKPRKETIFRTIGWILTAVMLLWLVLNLWWLCAVVLNDLLYINHIRGEWTEILVTNTPDDSTYLAPHWSQLPPPIPAWLEHLIMPLARLSLSWFWGFSLVGAGLWLCGFPQQKTNRGA